MQGRSWREGLGLGSINHCIHSFNTKTWRKKKGGRGGEAHIIYSLSEKLKKGMSSRLASMSSQPESNWASKGIADSTGAAKAQLHAVHHGVHRTAVALLLGTQVLCLAGCQLFICSKTKSEKCWCWKRSCLEVSKQWCHHTCGPLQLWHYSFLFFAMHLLNLLSPLLAATITNASNNRILLTALPLHQQQRRRQKSSSISGVLSHQVFKESAI